MIENALVAGFTSVGMDVLLLGPIPTPGRRHADALDARRPRRDDLGLAQSLRRQRHQAVRPRRLQALRRGRELQIEAPDRFRSARKRLAKPAASRPRQAHRRRARPATSNSPSARCPEEPVARRHAGRRRLRQRRRLQVSRRRRCGSSAPRSSRSASSRTASTSTRTAARPRRRRSPARCARCAPTSASRSTATPTA